MFRGVYRSSSGALTVFAASGLHTHVLTGRSQVWVRTEFPLRLDFTLNQRLQIQLELLMMSGVPLETCSAFNERWNNKFYYTVASCWLFLLSHTTIHGSMNIKFEEMIKDYQWITQRETAVKLGISKEHVGHIIYVLQEWKVSTRWISTCWQQRWKLRELKFARNSVTPL